MSCSGGGLIHRGTPLSLRVHEGKLPELESATVSLAVWGEAAAVSQRVRAFGAVPLAPHGLSRPRSPLVGDNN